MLTRIIATEPRCRLRGIETCMVQCVLVRSMQTPLYGPASFIKALERSHPGLYPHPLGPCLRTPGEAVVTFRGYTHTGRNAGAVAIPIASLVSASNTGRAANYPPGAVLMHLVQFHPLSESLRLPVTFEALATLRALFFVRCAKKET